MVKRLSMEVMRLASMKMIFACMLAHVDYGVPDYSTFTKEEFDSCSCWNGTDDNTLEK